MLLALLGALPQLAGAADRTLTALEWSSDGAALSCLAGDSVAVQALRIDVATGAVTATAPRLADPSWNPVQRRVLCRDDFDVYEVALDAPLPRPLAFLPAESNIFLRALGCDPSGALLLWTIAKDSGAHGFWMRRGVDLEALPSAASGPDALRWWDAHNVARPFAPAGGQFTRSTCVQRSHGDQRLCLERFGDERPVFRLVLASAARTNVVLDRCVPAGFAVNADSSLAVVALYEEPDAAGQSEVLSLWMSDFEIATRVSETVLERPVSTHARHRAWVQWLSPAELLWVDDAGQLLRLQAQPPSATVLVRRGAGPRPVAWAPPADGEDGPQARAADGSIAFTRHRRMTGGMQSEIWVASPGAAPRLLLPVWESVMPRAVP